MQIVKFIMMFSLELVELEYIFVCNFKNISIFEICLKCFAECTELKYSLMSFLSKICVMYFNVFIITNL